ncbi:MAG: hypothetical protein QOE51_3263 [Actinoplanes sp.]|jgi:peptidoglycan/LPS O-acetylase OafA/YrhL|nr:hypothetical protein [Actinoplanes sp.]
MSIRPAAPTAASGRTERQRYVTDVETAPPTEASPPAPRRARLAVLDGLRLLAAVAVLSKHWVGVGTADLTANHQGVHPWGTTDMGSLFGPVHAAATYGWLGVNLFFLISGFVICMSAWGRSLSDFFTSRVARLFPAYWFAVILTALVLLYSGLTSGNPLESSPTNILLNLTMSQQGSGGIDLDPSYWTLWYEMRFYLLFAIVVLLGVTYRRVVAFCALWTVATIIAATSDDKLAELVTMFRYAPYFIAGVALFVIYKYGSNLLLWGIVGFNYLLALSRIRSQADGQFGGSGVEPNTTTLCLVLTVCFAVMALVALRLLDRVQWRWLTVAGALTYPLYLMHQVIGFSLINTVRSHLHLPAVEVLALAFVAMLTLSWLVWRFIERPLSRRLRNGLRSSFAGIDQDEATPPARIPQQSTPEPETPARELSAPLAR